VIKKKYIYIYSLQQQQKLIDGECQLYGHEEFKIESLSDNSSLDQKEGKLFRRLIYYNFIDVNFLVLF